MTDSSSRARGLLAALASVDKQIKACKDKQQLAVLSAVRELLMGGTSLADNAVDRCIYRAQETTREEAEST